MKPTRCTNFTNLFWHETLHVLDSSSVHHQQFIHCRLSNGICHTALEQDQDGTAVPSCSCCPKHVEFHARINLCNYCIQLVLLQRNFSRCTVTCHDARSHVTTHGHMSRRTVTCHDARSHVTMHGHMSRCMVTCHDA